MTRRWHSIDCAHVGLSYAPVSGCPGCQQMRAEGIEPQQRTPATATVRSSGYRFTRKAPLDDAVARGVDRQRGWRKWNDAEGQYEQLLTDRDRMGGGSD